MKNIKAILIPLFLIILIFAIGAIFYKSTGEKASPPQRISLEKLVKSTSPWIGVENAKVVVVEFLDPECSACAAQFPMVKGIVSDYKNKIKFVVRYMLFHKSAKVAAIATEAAGRQGKYWEMQAQLFFRKDWTMSDVPRFDIFEDIAKNLGLNINQFKTDSKDPVLEQKVLADYEEGKAIGISATPTIFVNGLPVDELSYENLKSRIEEELKSSSEN